MAAFRKIHTTFWSDSFISGLDPEKKLFYIYLLTNERTTQCGIYEITKKQMSFDTGYTIDRVSILLGYFISAKKIRYSDRTNEIAIKNWVKYNGSTSPKVQSCINKGLTNVKDTVLIQYIYSTDTCSQEEEEKEEEKEEEEEFLFLKEEKEKESENSSFEKVWKMYGMKGNKKTSFSKWKKLSLAKKRLALVNIPTYVESTPDKQFRKNFETYINQEVWNDEITRRANEYQRNSSISDAKRRELETDSKLAGYISDAFKECIVGD